MGQKFKMKDVFTKGITDVTQEDMKEANKNNKKIKLLGRLIYDTAGWKGEVKPIQLDNSHPLANVSGATNAITFSTEILGDITVIGPGAGRLETGYSVIEDLIAIGNKKQKVLMCINLKNSNGGKTKMSNINDVNVENLKDYMGVITNDKEKAMIDYNVNLEWQGGTKSKVTTNDIQLGDETLKRDFSFYIDEPEQLLGKNDYPTPQEYLLGGMGACMMVGY